MAITFKSLVTEHINNAGGDRDKGLETFRDQFLDVAEEKKWRLNDVGFRPLFEAMVDVDSLELSDAVEVSEAMTASGYPALVSALLHPTIIEPYQPIADEVMPLVAQLPGKHKIEYLGGFGAMDDLELVREGMPYEEGQPAERKAKVVNEKFGKVISVTLEMVMFDQTNDVLTFAAGVGEKAGLHLHKMIVQRATDQACSTTGQAVNTSLDLDGTTYTMYSNDHATIDSQTNDNLATAALTSDVLTTVRAMFASLKDDKGSELLLKPNMLLVTPSNVTIAKQIVFSQGEFDGASSANYNPHKGVYKILETPYLDVASAWYVGQFAKQTKLVWIYKMKTWTKKGDTQIAFSNDIVAQFKAGYYAGVACTDYRYVICGKKS